MPNLDPISIASMIAAGALAATRLLATAKPVWDRLPASVQGLIPVLVLVLPQVATAAAGVHTSLDLTNLIVLSVALILPGVHSHTVAIKPPSGPGSAGGMMPVFALALCGGLACSALLPSQWNKLGACADVLQQPLLNQVAAVLAGAGDVESGLLAIVKSGAAKEAVECAVAQLVNDIGKQPADSNHARIRARGRVFLASVPQ